MVWKWLRRRVLNFLPWKNITSFVLDGYNKFKGFIIVNKNSVSFFYTIYIQGYKWKKDLQLQLLLLLFCTNIFSFNWPIHENTRNKF